VLLIALVLLVTLVLLIALVLLIILAILMILIVSEEVVPVERKIVEQARGFVPHDSVLIVASDWSGSLQDRRPRKRPTLQTHPHSASTRHESLATSLHAHTYV
jgi:hypothetical protein